MLLPSTCILSRLVLTEFGRWWFDFYFKSYNALTCGRRYLKAIRFVREMMETVEKTEKKVRFAMPTQNRRQFFKIAKKTFLFRGLPFHRVNNKEAFVFTSVKETVPLQSRANTRESTYCKIEISIIPVIIIRLSTEIHRFVYAYTTVRGCTCSFSKRSFNRPRSKWTDKKSPTPPKHQKKINFVLLSSIHQVIHLAARFSR